jgi:hypothetical protein
MGSSRKKAAAPASFVVILCKQSRHIKDIGASRDVWRFRFSRNRVMIDSLFKQLKNRA